MADSAREQLRSRFRRLRKVLPAAERVKANLAINQRLMKSRFFQDARTIALYAAFDGEPDLDLAIDAALAQHKQVFLPVLPERKGQPLKFARLEARQLTETNSYGIEQPAAAPDSLISPTAIDLVIVPLVAFDPYGNRLGMGGGYYDRTFAFVADCRQTSVPRLVGVAFEFKNMRD